MKQHGRSSTPHIYERVRRILESARTSAARTVNSTQVVANWLIGREIVEEEQGGRAKAAYGIRLLQELSRRLQQEYGNGYSVDNLELCRRFYCLLVSSVIGLILMRQGQKTDPCGRA